jgi:hypothetical protein
MKKVLLKNRIWLQAIKTLRKVIRYSKGGLTVEERWEIAHEFLLLGTTLLEELLSDLPSSDTIKSIDHEEN